MDNVIPQQFYRTRQKYLINKLSSKYSSLKAAIYIKLFTGIHSLNIFYLIDYYPIAENILFIQFHLI